MSLTYFAQLPFELLGELLYYFPIQEIDNALDESGLFDLLEFVPIQIIIGYGLNCINAISNLILKIKPVKIIKIL